MFWPVKQKWDEPRTSLDASEEDSQLLRLKSKIGTGEESDPLQYCTCYLHIAQLSLKEKSSP